MALLLPTSISFCSSHQKVPCRLASKKAFRTGSPSTSSCQALGSRREVVSLPLLLLPGLSLLGNLGPATGSARANPLEDVARALLRPELSMVSAVVALLDAASTLNELAELASTPADSEERFHARALLPGMASRLRQVGAAAPVVASAVSGMTDREATLGAYYGGTNDEGQAGLTDGVYTSLGRVLTISGRTIRVTAQESPEPAISAAASINELLAKVPREVMAEAKEFRKQRAAQLAEKMA